MARSVAECSAPSTNWLAILVLVAAGVAVVWLPEDKLVAFGGSFVVDQFARFLKLLALTGSGFAILLSLDYLVVEKQQNSNTRS